MLAGINSPSIRNAINYLLFPEKELTMLAGDHRKMVAKYLLRTAYDKSSFVADILPFFLNRIAYYRLIH